MLSVIVPIHNGEKFINKCLDSILSQSYTDMEVICVDDGSTDSTLTILKERSLEDDRIRVLQKKKNDGLVAARKTGINAAKGEYAAYIDCDDWIESSMFFDMMKVAINYNTDIVTSGIIYEGKYHKIAFDGYKEGLYLDDELEYLKRHIFFSPQKYEEGIRANLVNKIYRTDLIRSVQNEISDIISYGEDRLTTLKCVINANSLYVLNRAYYHYIIYGKSMSSGENPFFLDQIGTLQRELNKIINISEYKYDLKKQSGMYIARLLMKGINDNLGIDPADMFWIHPSWVKDIPKKSKIILYGCGRRGKTYYRQIVNDYDQGIEIVAWVDKNCKNIDGFSVDIIDPAGIPDLEYDYIVVSIEDDVIFDEIKRYLISIGVKPDAVMRPMPLDCFWEFAESAGLYLE